MPDESIFLLSDEERAFCERLYAEITDGLTNEGVDGYYTATDRGFTRFPLSAEQVTTVNRSLTVGPKKSLDALRAIRDRKAFFFMLMGPKNGGLTTLSVEDFAAHFPEAPADKVKANTYYSAPGKPSFVAFDEWFFCKTDAISNLGSPWLMPITPFTPEYYLLGEHRPQRPQYSGSVEVLAQLRNMLGLTSYLFTTESEWSRITTCIEYLEEAKRILDADNARKAAESRATRERAAEKGAASGPVSALIAVPSSKTDVLAPVYREMLTRNRIFKLRDEEKKKMDEQEGRLIPLEVSGSGPHDLIDDPKTGFLSVVLSYVYNAFEAAPDTQGDSVKIYLPKFYEGTRIDPRPIYAQRDTDLAPIEQLRYEKMISLLRPYEDCVGRTPDGSFYRLASVGGYEKATETFTIYCPYLFECIRQTDKSRFLRLIHQDIANETNTAAVEVVCEIARGLITRGSTTPDAATYNRDFREPEQTGDSQQIIIEPKKTGKRKPLFNYTTTFRGVIAKCPQFLHDLEEIENAKDENGNPKKGRAQAYNSKLKQVFSAAFRILQEKTDFPRYYLDFTIENATGKKKDFFIVPTKTTIGKDKIRITHNGRNPDFTR